MNYAIFRSEPIYTTKDLAQIGSHNKREKKEYKSNKDIKIELSKNNIELVPLREKYVKGFYNITEEYKKEHNERMKNERPDRRRTFTDMINTSKNVVADELLFTATNKFFENMTNDDIKEWANTCMEFVYNDLGYTKNQVLHATVHMDEKTPHIHCVVVPLVKKYDKRTNSERYTISKKQYIKDKMHLSTLQDKYHERLVSKGYDLERGIKGSDAKHIPIKEFKEVNRRLEKKLNIRNDKLEQALNDFENKMKTTKNTIIDKDYVKVKKDTLDSMKKVIEETKKISELQPKIDSTFNEINNYTSSYNTLERNNLKYKREIDSLNDKNLKLQVENQMLKDKIEQIIDNIKDFFRLLLEKGTELIKNLTSIVVKEQYDKDILEDKDVYHISKGTSKEDDLFDYANIPDYYKEYRKDKHKDKDDFDLSL